MLDLLWVEKYRPTTVAEYIFPNAELGKAVLGILDSGNLPHLLLSGGAGCGKTTLAKVLINDLGVNPIDVMFLNTSDENSVDVFRDKIKQFAETWAFDKFKVVVLDEADYATPQYQAALRNLMEAQSDTCRFILTCNYPNKIIEPVKSRCQHWKFPRPDIDDITTRAVEILIAEKVNFTLEQLDNFVRLGYPDTRKIINLLQQYTTDGVLQDPTSLENNSEWEYEILECIKKKDFSKIREIVSKNAMLDDYDRLYQLLYRNTMDPQSIIYIADYLYRHAFVSDPEINFSALCEKLGMLEND